MLPFLREHHADPGRLHAEGRVTRVALEDAREQVAVLLGARPREVVFTASGTEAVNAAVWGAVARAETAPHLVTTAVEHSAVLDACDRAGAAVTVVGVDRQGRYDPVEVLAAVRPETALVTVQAANHEVGTIQPAGEVAAACRERGVLVHVDVCMAAGHVSVDFGGLGADLCSVSAHKFGGPKGAGAPLGRRGLRVPPFVVGGAQGAARRGGRGGRPRPWWASAPPPPNAGTATCSPPRAAPSASSRTGWHSRRRRAWAASRCMAIPSTAFRTWSAWVSRASRRSRSSWASTSAAWR